MERGLTSRPDRGPPRDGAPAGGRGVHRRVKRVSVRPRGIARSRAPREDWNSHLLWTHTAMRAAVAEGLAVDFHDARSAITSEHREDLSDPLPRDLGVTAPEETGRDGL